MTKRSVAVTLNHTHQWVVEADMPDEVALAIVTTLAVKAAELTADGLTGALRQLFHAIRNRFGTGTQEAAALDEALRRPDDVARQAAVADSLASVMAADPQFAVQLHAAWHDIEAQRGAVFNQFHGDAENVLQARDIGGDVRFGQ
jgi:hypothetical protein